MLCAIEYMTVFNPNCLQKNLETDGKRQQPRPVGTRSAVLGDKVDSATMSMALLKSCIIV